MARMVNKISVDAPESEKVVWNALRVGLPEPWAVIHSLNYVAQSGQKRREGEVDFLLIHPKVGIIALEAKGDAEVTNGPEGWAFKNHKGEWRKGKSPFEQASTGARELNTFLSKEAPELGKVPFGHGVVFPSFTEEESRGPEAPREIIIDREQLSDIESCVKKIIKQFDLKADFTPEQIKKIIKKLTSYKISKRSLKQVVDDTNQEILDLSESQFEILSLLSNQTRAIIEGPAGSGKTILAIECARRKLQEGKKVLLLCFNELLGKHLKETFSDDDNIRAGSFHEFCQEMARESGLEIVNEIDQIDTKTEEEKSRFWQIDLPESLPDAIYKNEKTYDALIIDEAQDFTVDWIETLEHCLGDLGEDPFFLFLDRKQKFEGQDWESPWPEQKPYPLTENWRCSEPIAEKVRSIWGEETTSKGPASELKPEWVEAETNDEIIDLAIECALNLLIEEKLDPSQIVVLTGNTALRDELKNGPLSQRDFKIETVRRFKGLDAEVVVLVLPEESKPVDPKIAYVGMSRARALLRVVGPKSKRKDLNFGGKK